MKFRTEYIPIKAPFMLSPEKPVVLAGSCFSQNIGGKMKECGWVAFNPLGTLYNPFSIAMAIDMMLDKKKGKQRFDKSLFEYNGLWNSHRFDSSFSSMERNDTIREFEIRQQEFLNTLEEGKVLIVTFGTSICYQLRSDNSIVSNCHKQPSDLFVEKRMTYYEILSYWDEVIKELKETFPGIKIIFTVSPVRHLKNGFVGNNRSKAVLQLGIEEIIRYNEDCYYFPAYEILNDDLRDYRFYADDLAHPSKEAIEYIWEKFRETFIDEKGDRLIEEGSKAYRALNHRPKTGALGKPLNS